MEDQGGRDRDKPRWPYTKTVWRRWVESLRIPFKSLGGINLLTPPAAGDALVYDGQDWAAGTGGGTTVVQVHNQSGSTLALGTPVYVSGTHSSGKPLVEPALADGSLSPLRMPAIGLIQADIADGEEGKVVAAGELVGIDTDTPGWDDGTPLYVSGDTAGELVSSKPDGFDAGPPGYADQIQKVALVTRRHQTVGSVVVMGAGRVNDQNNELTRLIGRRDAPSTGTFVGTSMDTDLGASPGDPIPDNSTIYDALTLITQDLGVPTDGSVTESKIGTGAVTREKLAVAIDSSVLLTHVTNTGSVTSVTLQQGGQALGENAVGVPLDRACTSNSAVVSWRADTAPAGTWTLTLKKKAAGSRSYTTAATMSVTVNNG